MSTNQRLKIVLSADIRYAEQIVTTIKSICFHNKNIDFYLFNKDFSQEWLNYLNQQLNRINCCLFDVKINYQATKFFSTYPHINSESTYFRYFIPEVFIEDSVLYLDCDVLVTGSISHLCNMNLGENFVAAVKDPIAECFYQRYNEFNAGVMLINNRLWKQENICSQALNLTTQYMQANCLRDGDQQVLNDLFSGKWLKLPKEYNYQVGLQYMYASYQLPFELETLPQLPLIIHFSTAMKPWLVGTTPRFREYYWAYYGLSWEEIIAKQNEIP